VLERLVGDVRRYNRLAHERPAGEVLYQFLRGSGLLSKLASMESVAAEEALQNIARFFESSLSVGLAAGRSGRLRGRQPADAHRRG